MNKPYTYTNLKEYISDAQVHLSAKHKEIFSNVNVKDDDEFLLMQKIDDNVCTIIQNYCKNNAFCFENGMNINQLTLKIYDEMMRLSIITPYIKSDRTDVEEININSWHDIAIHYDDGRIEKLPNGFLSPEHAIDKVKKLLRMSGNTMDKSSPTKRGHLGKNIRITATLPPVIDEDIGVVASIRIINSKKFKKRDFMKNETASEEMLDFLNVIFKYNISTCISGAANAGKTTLMSWVLSKIPNTKRLITIEEGVREFNLIKTDNEGKTINNVVHLTTKYSEKKEDIITSEDLLATSLTLHPDFIAVGEMKDKEAFAAQEAARTGHAVIATTHANSCVDTYNRLATLCMLKHGLNYETTMSLVKTAFPIVVFMKRLEDNKRHIMEIAECIPTDKGFRNNCLYKYVITENNIDCDKMIIKGEFKKINNISNELKQKLRDNGMQEAHLETIFMKNEKIKES